MLNQNNLRGKISEFKGEVKQMWEKLTHKADKDVYRQADGEPGEKSDYSSRPEIHEFTPDEQVSTAPRSKTILSDGSIDAQKLVWDNEDASMQDKSYSFDEETTDAEYEFEDSLDFEDDSGSGQESRYS